MPGYPWTPCHAARCNTRLTSSASSHITTSTAFANYHMRLSRYAVACKGPPPPTSSASSHMTARWGSTGGSPMAMARSSRGTPRRCRTCAGTCCSHASYCTAKVSSSDPWGGARSSSSGCGRREVVGPRSHSAKRRRPLVGGQCSAPMRQGGAGHEPPTQIRFMMSTIQDTLSGSAWCTAGRVRTTVSFRKTPRLVHTWHSPAGTVCTGIFVPMISSPGSWCCCV